MKKNLKKLTAILKEVKAISDNPKKNINFVDKIQPNEQINPSGNIKRC